MQSAQFNVKLSASLQVADRLALETAFKGAGELIEKTTREPLSWVAFVLIMKQVGTVAGALTALLKLADEIVKWRDKLRHKKQNPSVVITREGAPTLNLETATDEEIRQWFHLER